MHFSDRAHCNVYEDHFLPNIIIMQFYINSEVVTIHFR